jgi:hypothetical protein
MIKKDLDIKSIIKNSVLRAQKDHGLLKEAEEQPAQPTNIKRQREPFDPEKHMPKIQISSKTWGQKGSLDAKELDRYIQPITQGSGDFKAFLKNFNAALGITYGNSKTPVYTFISKDDMTLQKVVSSLVLRQLMASIVVKNSAKSAGDIWEGFFARVVEGSLPKDSPIEDIKEPDESGNLVSLKLIQRNGEVDFSTLNLAVGIARASDLRIFDTEDEDSNLDVDQVLGRGVKFIIGEKIETSDNVIAIKFYSFIVNRNNFFQVMLNNPTPPAAEVYQLIKDLTGIDVVAVLDGREGAALTEAKQGRQASYTGEKFKKFALDFLYPKNENGEREFLANTPENYKEQYRKVIVDTVTKIYNNEYSKDALFKILARKEGSLQDIINLFVITPADVKDAKGKESTNTARAAILRLLNYGYNPESIQQERGQDEKDELRQYLLKVRPELAVGMEQKAALINSIIKQADDENPEITTYREKLKKDLTAEKQLARELIGSLTNIFDNLYGDFLNYYQGEREEQYAKSVEHTKQFLDSPDKAIRAMTALFWDVLAGKKNLQRLSEATDDEQEDQVDATEDDGSEGSEKKEKSSGFKDKKNTLKTGILLKANYINVDESYDPIYLDTKELFISTTKTLDIFRDYAEDIYRDRYEMDSAIEKYFIDDEPSGMTELEITINNMGDHVNELREKTGGEFIKPSEIKPKRDVKTARESLNRDPIDDILDLL